MIAPRPWQAEFLARHATHARPDFLLAPGELLRAYATLRVVAYEDGFLDAPPRYVQRIAAVREQDSAARPRYLL